MGQELLAEWRKQQGLSQRVAAERVGVSQAAWSGWESGASPPTIAHASKIAEVTGGAVPVESWAPSAAVPPATQGQVSA